MKLYNKNTDKIEDIELYESFGVNYIINKLTPDQLNDIGLYKVEFTSPPNRKEYTFKTKNEIVNNKYTKVYYDAEKKKDIKYKIK